MLKVKEELGKDALIVSMRTIKPKGIFKLFKKPTVEVTAALDERNITISKTDEPMLDPSSYIPKNFFEPKPSESNNITHKQEKPKSTPQNKFIKLLYKQLMHNDVNESVINDLLLGLEGTDLATQIELKDLISKVYERIYDHLNDVETIQIDNKQKPNIVVFIGPTGVGKTTTIAKIASYFSLNKNKKVGLITADTYRIAAVEQLKTYATILDLPVQVIYTKDEIHTAIEALNDRDLILIDTAGRSHKNEEQLNELEELLYEIDKKKVFVVLSLTTKYKDLKKMIGIYSKISDFNVIFTKLDETSTFGNILNLKHETGYKLSYISYGQNVPDDFSQINIQDITNNLLGGDEDGSSLES